MLIQRLQLLYVYTNLIPDVYTSSAGSPCGPHEHRRLSAYLQVVDFTRVGAVLSCTSPLPRVFSFSCFLVGDQRSIDGCEGCEPLLSLSLSLLASRRFTSTMTRPFVMHWQSFARVKRPRGPLMLFPPRLLPYLSVDFLFLSGLFLKNHHTSPLITSVFPTQVLTRYRGTI